jgi:acyl-CoA hydrolase
MASKTSQKTVSQAKSSWKKRIVSPDAVLERIRPGMRIFIGTGVAEPLTLVRHLKALKSGNLTDLELFQLVSLGDAIDQTALDPHKYRLKTFFTGWEAEAAITEGMADFIPSRYYQIPELFQSQRIPIDVAFVQITAPDRAGFCSLGVCVDVARQAMAQAELVVGEINPWIPRTFGDTFVRVDEFDLLVESTEPPLYFERWKVDPVYDRIGANVAVLIEDGSCIAFSIGPLYEALSRHLKAKRDLGIHTPFFFDNLMDLVICGAANNSRKDIYRGKSLTSYGIGTRSLMRWLNNNPLVEFQSIQQVFNPFYVSRNRRFVAVMQARKVDLSGRIALHTGKGNVGSGPAEAIDFFIGAQLSEGGQTVFAMPSRNRDGQSNIQISVRDYPNQFSMWESVDAIVTEHGIVSMKGKTVRERAQALIDIAHPDDRAALIAEARKRRIIYPDQIFIASSGHRYPAELASRHTFKNDVEVRFRAVKPSDEEGMRRLFYRLSDETVFSRYFYLIRTMPHDEIQQYVNVDYQQSLSIVGLVGKPGEGRIIAEARFDRLEDNAPSAEFSIVVDESYQGLGIGPHLCRLLIPLAKERQIHAFTADVLSHNQKMLHMVSKIGWRVKARFENGIYRLDIDLP